ncbi:MAG: winged helix-turn-helix transcriptional regulator [Clostridiaceae bacterium]|nr:winged helix-turn-helix transcriptional regulator [Clostridiaceae bacterium]
MEYYGKVLSYINKGEDISQRKIAKHMGLSLGQTNFILHSLVKKGLLKMERITPKKVKYILTPQGIAKNARRTYSYIVNAIKNVLSLEAELLSIVEYYTSKGFTVYLDSKKDEVYNILLQVIKDRCLKQVKLLKDTDELKEVNGKALVIIWHNDREEIYKRLDIKCFNLLDNIEIF